MSTPSAAIVIRLKYFFPIKKISPQIIRKLSRNYTQIWHGIKPTKQALSTFNITLSPFIYLLFKILKLISWVCVFLHLKQNCVLLYALTLFIFTIQRNLFLGIFTFQANLCVIVIQKLISVFHDVEQYYVACFKT